MIVQVIVHVISLLPHRSIQSLPTAQQSRSGMEMGRVLLFEEDGGQVQIITIDHVVGSAYPRAQPCECDSVS